MFSKDYCPRSSPDLYEAVRRCHRRCGYTLSESDSSTTDDEFVERKRVREEQTSDNIVTIDLDAIPSPPTSPGRSQQMEVDPPFEQENENDVPREVPVNNNNNNNNNQNVDDEIRKWLAKHVNESKWKQPREELRKKGYFFWEEICMLYYLMESGKYNRYNTEKIWTLMKNQYEFLPHRSCKSLHQHFEQILQWRLSQYDVPDEVIATIVSHRIKE